MTKEKDSTAHHEAIEWLKKEIAILEPMVIANENKDWSKWGFIQERQQEKMSKKLRVEKHLLTTMLSLSGGK